MQAVRLTGVVVAVVVVRLALLGPQVTTVAPAEPGHVAQNGSKTGPVPGVHPAIDQRVVARVRHGQPVEQEPDIRQAAPRAQRRFVVPQDLRHTNMYFYYDVSVIVNRCGRVTHWQR